MDDQRRKQLQVLMSDPRWAAVELFFTDFMARHFINGSIKRGSEFDTIWYAAEQEGAKRYLQLFFHEMEKDAQAVSTE